MLNHDDFDLCQAQNPFLKLTHGFFQGGWHFPENPKIDGDTDPFLKSGKILNHHAAPARICISKI